MAYIKPGTAFQDLPTPPPPDYSSESTWAALPDRPDNADLLPKAEATQAEVPGASRGTSILHDGQANAKVDCFYIHGTTYIDDASWNQPLDSEVANRLVDDRVLPVQGGVFNGSCRVYVPRYRQATLYAFADSSESASQARELAYQDLKRAFLYFLEVYNQGRPFVFAGHSQGSVHGFRLLNEVIPGTELARRLVVTYLPGWDIKEEDLSRLPDVPVCETPRQTNCLATWNSEGANPRGGPIDLTQKDTVCVNPLSWRTDGAYVGPEKNLGGWIYAAGDGEEVPAPIPGLVDAQCRDGGLRVTEPRAKQFRNGFLVDSLLGREVYHNFDYAYFYMNIRQNVAERVEAYLSAHP